MKYRPEIDGLRALAVIPVILFHAGFKFFSGGFVGVDIFLVISGYLITSILVEEINQKRFSIINFYERRARRILPALFFVMFISILFSWLLMLPNQMQDFSKSIIAVCLFASNIFFSRQTNYFAPSAELSPLLHTWSLAVEEQYYIIFPIFLILFWSLGKKKLFWIIIIIALLSLLLSEWGWRNRVIQNFFLAPTRAWELLAGSIAAFIFQKRGARNNNVLALIGLALIIFSIFLFDENTPIPSFFGLVPVLGVLLIILFAGTNTLLAKFLSLKSIVGIGLISYSAYLWHHLLFVFIRIMMLGENEKLGILFACLTIPFLAILTWKYIEQPFRNKKKFSKKFIFLFTLSGLLFFISFGLIGNKFKGFDYRLSQWQKDILEWENYPRELPYKEGKCFLRPEQSFTDLDNECITNDADILIWGDSHAAALASGWRNISKIDQITASGCPPVLNKKFTSRKHCLKINNHAKKIITDKKYKIILMHSNWDKYSKEQLQNLTTTIQQLKKLGIQKIYLIGGVPQYQPSLPKRLLIERKNIYNIDYITQSQNEVLEQDKYINSLIPENDAIYIDSLNIFCKKNKCKVTTKYENKTIPISWDYGHLTEGGSIFLAKEIENIILKQ